MPITAENIVEPADSEASFPPDEGAHGARPPGTLYSPNIPGFTYVFHPELPSSWSPETITEGEPHERGTWWLCHPMKLPRRAGSNGHRAHDPSDPGSATSVARDIVRRNGGLWLESRPPYRYVVRRDAVHPITGQDTEIHFEAFATPLPNAKGRKLRFKFDRQAYLRFLRTVLAAGLLDVTGPAEEIVADRIARAGARVERVRRDKARSDAERKEAVKAATEVLARVEAAKDVTEPGGDPAAAD